jgi:hypothetical protein
MGAITLVVVLRAAPRATTSSARRAYWLYQRQLWDAQFDAVIVDQVKEPSFPSRMPISTAAAAADAGNHHHKGYSDHPAVLTAPLCLSLLSSNLSVYQ